MTDDVQSHDATADELNAVPPRRGHGFEIGRRATPAGYRVGRSENASRLATISANSRLAWVALTTRRYQSGEIDHGGHISRRGDSHLRELPYEAATVLLVRSRSEGDLRKWWLLRERLGFKRAATDGSLA